MAKENKIKGNVPNLRFPGFETEWEEKKLGEVFSIFNGYAFPSNKSLDSGALWVKIADVGIQKMKRDNLSFLPLNFKKKYSKFLLKKGDYVVALTRPILNGKLKIAQIDDFFDDALLNQRVGKIETENSNGFIYSYLQKSDLIKLIEDNIAGTDPPNLSPNEINSIRLTIPAIPEQIKIASFLSLIDDRIKTQNKIIEGLKVQILGLQEQIFRRKIKLTDKNGDNFPEWELKTMKELFTFKITNSFSREQLNYENGLVKNIHYGDIHTKFHTLFDIQKEEVPYINTDVKIDRISEENYCAIGDMIFADASEDLIDVGKSIEIVNLNNQKLLAGLHTILARPINRSFEVGFCGYLFKSDGVKSQIQKESQGSKVLSISAIRLSKISISIPCIDEQTKIVNLLSSIDAKINIENRLLDKLKEQKKFLLQQMFV